MSERVERALTGLLVLVAGYFVISAVRSQFKGRVSPAIAETDKPPERLQDWDALVAAGVLLGDSAAKVRVLVLSDLECPYCGRAEPAVRELLRDFGDVRYVWRHLPLTDVHPRAQLAAEAAEAAGEQGLFWAMHDQLLAHQDQLEPDDLLRHAGEVGLDVERFEADLRQGKGAARIAEDVEGADLSGVAGTPTFFVNGRRHHGAYDVESLSAAVRAAGARAELASTPD